MLKAVLSSKVTRADDVKPVPLTVNAKGVAVLTWVTLSELMEGTKFSKVTLAEAVLLGSAVLTASMVTELDDGMAAGAVYLPVWSMVPVAAILVACIRFHFCDIVRQLRAGIARLCTAEACR